MDIKEVLRDKILGNEYCKFDLVVRLFPEHKLLKEKTWILRQELADELGIKVEDINAKTFSQWRSRLKKKSKKNEREDINDNRISPTPDTENEKLNREFQPLDYNTFPKKEEDIERFIKPVIHKPK